MNLQDPAIFTALAPLLTPSVRARLERGDGLTPADLIDAQRSLHALSPSEKRALVQGLQNEGNAEAATLISAAAAIAPSDFGTVASLAMPTDGPAAAAPSLSTEHLAAAHRALQAVPAPTRAVLAEQLPASAQPLVSLAADLDEAEFIEAAQPVLTAVTTGEAIPTSAYESPILQGTPVALGSGGGEGGGAPPSLASSAQSVLSSAWVVGRAQVRLQLAFVDAAVAELPSINVRALGLTAAALTFLLAVLSFALCLLALQAGRAILSASAALLAAALLLVDAEGSLATDASGTLLGRAPLLHTARGRAAVGFGAAFVCLVCGGPLVLGGAVLLLPASLNVYAHHLAAPRLAALLEQLPSATALVEAFNEADDRSGGKGALLGPDLAHLGSPVGGRALGGRHGAVVAIEEEQLEEPLLPPARPLLVHGATVALCPLGGHQVTLRGLEAWGAAAHAAASAQAPGAVEPAATAGAFAGGRALPPPSPLPPPDALHGTSSIAAALQQADLQAWVRRAHMNNPTGLALVAASACLAVGSAAAAIAALVGADLVLTTASLLLLGGFAWPLLLLELTVEAPHASLRALASRLALPWLRSVPDLAMPPVRAALAVVGAAALGQVLPREMPGLAAGTLMVTVHSFMLATVLAAGYSAYQWHMARHDDQLTARFRELL